MIDSTGYGGARMENSGSKTEASLKATQHFMHGPLNNFSSVISSWQ